MAQNQIAPDSATDLRTKIGDDATATFEESPNFVQSNPTGNASSENVELQRDTDDLEDSDEEIEDEDDDEGDVDDGVDEDELDDDDLDTDKVAA